MSLADVLGTVVEALRASGIPHMVAGSMASTRYSEPRTTRDVDVVIDPTSEADLEAFVARLDAQRFYVGDHRAAFRQRAMFNVIDVTNGWKIDLMVRRDRPFSANEFARRRPTTIDGVAADLATPEDVILSKLEWAQLGESERQRADVRAVLTAVGDDLDHTYLEFWATELGVLDALRTLLDETTADRREDDPS